jgi:hypothetical protein
MRASELAEPKKFRGLLQVVAGLKLRLLSSWPDRSRATRSRYIQQTYRSLVQNNHKNSDRGICVPGGTILRLKSVPVGLNLAKAYRLLPRART